MIRPDHHENVAIMNPLGNFGVKLFAHRSIPFRVEAFEAVLFQDVADQAGQHNILAAVAQENLLFPSLFWARHHIL